MPGLNLVFSSYTKVGDPADDAETAIGSIDGVTTIFDGQPVYLHGWATIVPGADATSVVLAFRRGTLAGHEVDEGPEIGIALDAGGDPAATIVECYMQDLPGNAQNATYVLTATVNDASAGSTVTGIYIEARVG